LMPGKARKVGDSTGSRAGRERADHKKTAKSVMNFDGIDFSPKS
jgi:hypothetical protein